MFTIQPESERDYWTKKARIGTKKPFNHICIYNLLEGLYTLVSYPIQLVYTIVSVYTNNQMCSLLQLCIHVQNNYEVNLYKVC